MQILGHDIEKRVELKKHLKLERNQIEEKWKNGLLETIILSKMRKARKHFLSHSDDLIVRYRRA